MAKKAEQSSEAAFGEEVQTKEAQTKEIPVDKLIDSEEFHIEQKIEKVLPKVPVIIDGKEQRKKRAIDLNISEQLLPPITKRSTAIYKLIHWPWDPSKPERLQMDVKRIDPSTKEEVPPQDLVLPGSYVFYDQWEKDPTKRTKTMFNWGRDAIHEDKEGDKFLKKEIKEIEFRSDFKHIDCEADYLEYVFMELHPWNASNRHRRNKATTQPIFMRVDIYNNKSNELMMLETDLAFEAESIVVKITNKEKIIALASSIPDIQVSGRLDFENIKYSLRQWARNHPREFFALSGDSTPAIKMTVLDAQGLGLIDFNPDTHRYIDGETRDTLHTVLTHEDPLDSFVAKLKQEPDLYSRVKNLLDYWEH